MALREGNPKYIHQSGNSAFCLISKKMNKNPFNQNVHVRYLRFTESQSKGEQRYLGLRI